MSQKGNNNVFKALANTKRRMMLDLLLSENYHITGLAKKLGISVPVATRHVKILEECGIVKRKKYGRTHIISICVDPPQKAAEAFLQTYTVDVAKGASVLDVLQKVSSVKMKRIGDNEFVASIDGKEGLYIYEVDGVISDKTITEMRLNKNTVIRWKRLIPASEREIAVKIKPAP